MKPGLLVSLLLLFAADAWGHRLDEYLQAARIAVATNRIELSLELTPGVTIVDQLLVVIDQNRNGQISKAEAAAYAQRVLKEVRLGLDDKELALSVEATYFPTMLEIKGGVGAIRIKATAAVAPLAGGKHNLTLTNAHLPAISVYLVNVLAPKDAAIKITKQTRDELQKNYRLEFGVSSP